MKQNSQTLKIAKTTKIIKARSGEILVDNRNKNVTLTLYVFFILNLEVVEI